MEFQFQEFLTFNLLANFGVRRKKKKFNLECHCFVSEADVDLVLLDMDDVRGVRTDNCELRCYDVGLQYVAVVGGAHMHILPQR